MTEQIATQSEGGRRQEMGISVVLLAAGESKRMGQPKQLLPLGKSTVLEQTISNLLNSEVQEVIVVLGHRAEEMARLLAGRPVMVVVNPDYRQGMSTSIAAGLGSASDEAQGIMLALAEQPFIDYWTINRLVAAFSTHGKGIIIPSYHGRRGHPVIFASRYKEELLWLAGDIGARQVVARHPDDILEIDVDCEGVITDIDTPESYNLEMSNLKMRRGNGR
ncbi:molybdenum cofactor cytidylyltransferase [Chloroflexota bacterium]